MAHPAQHEFCLAVRSRFPEHFNNKMVLDVGSLDINGNNKGFFNNCNYTGVDLGPGPNVDLITPVHQCHLPEESFDTIISTEALEHDQWYVLSLQKITRLLKPGGLFLFTCATTGRGEHGTKTTHSEALSPYTPDYYRNLIETDIRSSIDIDQVFEQYEFMVSIKDCDLYFWGIKHSSDQSSKSSSS